MRILYIIDTLSIGGAEKVCLDLITLLLDSGHQADCMVISAKGQLYDKIDKRAKAIFLDRKRKFDLHTMRKCSIIASSYEIVHVHMRHTWAYVKLSSLFFKKINGLIFHDHYGDIKINKKSTFRLRGFLKPHFYIGVSKELVNWAEDSLKLNKEHIFLLRNSIVPIVSYSNVYKGDWVLVSNIRETKNILFAIEMSKKMNRQLIIFGNHDGSSYADNVFDAAEKSNHVKIIQNETDIQQYLRNFKLGIHTSLSETGPLVLLEYMAQGLPFVTYNTGEVVNQIRDILPGMIADSFDQTEWTKKIGILEQLSNQNKIQVGNQLKKIFEDKFSPQVYIEKCQKIYQDLLGY